MLEKAHKQPELSRREFLLGGASSLVFLKELLLAPRALAQAAEGVARKFRIPEFTESLKQKAKNEKFEHSYMVTPVDGENVEVAFFEGSDRSTVDPIDTVTAFLKEHPDTDYVFAGHTHPTPLMLSTARRNALAPDPEVVERGSIPPSENDAMRAVINEAEARNAGIDGKKIVSVASDQHGVWIMQPFQTPNHGQRYFPDQGPAEVFSKDVEVVKQKTIEYGAERLRLREAIEKQIESRLGDDEVAKKFYKDLPHQCDKPENDQQLSSWQGLLTALGLANKDKILEQELLNCVRHSPESRARLAKSIFNAAVEGRDNFLFPRRNANKWNMYLPPRGDPFHTDGTVLEYILSGPKHLQDILKYRQIARGRNSLSRRLSALSNAPSKRFAAEAKHLYPEGASLNLFWYRFRSVKSTDFKFALMDVMRVDMSDAMSSDDAVNRVRNSEAFERMQRTYGLSMGLALQYVTYKEFEQALASTSGADELLNVK